jgi:ribonuclease P protein component
MEEKLLPADEHGAEKSLPLATRNALNSISDNAGIAHFNLSRLAGKQTFCAAEKLKSKKIIDQLFKEGKAATQSGFTLVYLQANLNTYYPIQAGFTVPKRFFKRAVDRNRVKRLMREIYRTQKFELYKKLQAQQKQLAIMFVYNGKRLPGLAETSKAMGACLKKVFKT